MKRKIHDVTSPRVPDTEVTIVLLLLAGGLLLRLNGLDYGLPFVFHPDENRQILDALGMAQRMSPLPAEFSYPALHKYLILAANGLYYGAGRMAGWFDGPEDFAFAFLTGESRVFLISRMLSVAAGMLTALASYAAARRLWGRGAGLAALAMTLFMFHLVQHSQWAIADIFLALFTTLSLCYAILYARAQRTVDFTAACAFTGLAVATKPQGLFLVVPLLAGLYFAAVDRGRAAFTPGVMGSAGLLFLLSLSGNISWLVDFDTVYEKFRMLSQVAHTGLSSREPFSPGMLSMSAWFVKELVRQETVLGAVLVAGIAYSIARRTREDVILLSYLAVYLFAVRDWAIRYLHLFVAFFPALCLFGARFLDDVLRTTSLDRKTAALAIAVVVAPSAYDSIVFSQMKEEPDTREVAGRWIEENIREGATIAYDWYEFPVPVHSETPLNLLNPKAGEYYRDKVPAGVKKRYSRFVSSKKSYNLVPVIYTTKTPLWPEGMDAATIRRIENKEVFRELFEVFNFRTLEELRAMGVEYLIITSYGYTNFLLDNDPYRNERGVFNYLLKEDMLGFNKQAERYIEDDRFGPLFFLTKRARDFYEPLLHGRTACRLVKEFEPSDKNLGPVIKIFRL